MAFDLRIDFRSNDLLLDSGNDARIIEGDNLLQQQIHNRLLIARGSYIHDQELGSEFEDVSRLTGDDLQLAIDGVVRDALADIPNMEIQSVQATRSPPNFEPKLYRPRKSKDLMVNGDFSEGVTAPFNKGSSALSLDNQIVLKSGDISLRSTYTAQPQPPTTTGHPSNMAYQFVQFPKDDRSTSIFNLWIPSDWDGGDSGPSLTMEAWQGTGVQGQANATNEVFADRDIRDTWQQIRCEFTPMGDFRGAIVLRGWYHESVPADEPSVGKSLITGGWETYNTTWPTIPIEPRDQILVKIDYELIVIGDYYDQESNLFPSDARTTSFVL